MFYFPGSLSRSFVNYHQPHSFNIMHGHFLTKKQKKNPDEREKAESNQMSAST